MEGDDEPASKRPRLPEEDSLDQPIPIVGAVSTRTVSGSAQLNHFEGTSVTADQSGVCYVTGYLCAKRGGGSRIQRIGSDGEVSVLAGSSEQDGDVDGVGDAARFSRPGGIAISPDGTTLFVADTRNHKIRQIDVATRTVSTLAVSGEAGSGEGVGTSAQFKFPQLVVISPDGRTLIVADRNRKIRQIDIATGVVSTLIVNIWPRCMAMSPDGAILFVGTFDDELSIDMVDIATKTTSTLEMKDAQVEICPMALQMSPDGEALYIASEYTSHDEWYSIWRLDLSEKTNCWPKWYSKSCQLLAGPAPEKTEGVDIESPEYKDGVGTEASFARLADITLIEGPNGVHSLVCLDGTTQSANRDECILREVVVKAPHNNELKVPPSTFAADMAKLSGDSTMPQGMVTFIVGPNGRKLEHSMKCVLCVRSEYFEAMFRSGIQCPDETVIKETSFEAFESVIKYLLTDELHVDTSTQHAFDTMDLARRFQMKRLEVLCQRAVEAGLDANNVLPLMDASHRLHHDRMVSRCRQYVASNAPAILAAGSVQQLTSLSVAKALLLDALSR